MESLEKLKRLKVDALYGKKKHFNAADRKEKRHYQIGIPLTVINIIIGSVLLSVISDNALQWLKVIPIALSFLAALLSGLQTYFNYQKQVEGHRRVGNRYLAEMKKCDRIHAYFLDKIIDSEKLVEEIELISVEMAAINQDAESFPTNKDDYKKAQAGIDSGEENYNDNELNL